VKKDERKKVYSITKKGMNLLEDLEKNRDKLDPKLRDKITKILEQVKIAKKDDPIDTGVGIYTASAFANFEDDPLLNIFKEEFK